MGFVQGDASKKSTCGADIGALVEFGIFGKCTHHVHATPTFCCNAVSKVEQIVHSCNANAAPLTPPPPLSCTPPLYSSAHAIFVAACLILD